MVLPALQSGVRNDDYCDGISNDHHHARSDTDNDSFDHCDDDDEPD
jgi:hypothetical protein